MTIKDMTIKDIMITNVVSVYPDTPLIEAAKILAEHNFDGVPVVDKQNRLVGILTEYDLISKSSTVHLPTFQTILQNLQVFKKDRSQFQKEIKAISKLTVKDVMNDDPLTFSEGTTYEEAVRAFQERHRVNPIPVITKDKKVIGVVSRFDILKPLQLMSVIK